MNQKKGWIRRYPKTVPTGTRVYAEVHNRRPETRNYQGISVRLSSCYRAAARSKPQDNGDDSDC